ENVEPAVPLYGLGEAGCRYRDRREKQDESRRCRFHGFFLSKSPRIPAWWSKNGCAGRSRRFACGEARRKEPRNPPAKLFSPRGAGSCFMRELKFNPYWFGKERRRPGES